MTTALLAPALERAAACVCREAGATVACNFLVRDLNIHPERLDDRRIEVNANGLSLWGGAQLAIPLCPLSVLVELRVVTSASTRAALLARHAGLRNAPTLSYCARRGAVPACYPCA